MTKRRAIVLLIAVAAVGIVGWMARCNVRPRALPNAQATLPPPQTVGLSINNANNNLPRINDAATIAASIDAVTTSDGIPTPTPTQHIVSTIFGEDCWFATPAHCQVWRELAQRCDDGDAAACKQLAELLLEQPPYQPLFARTALQRSCALGDDDACARAHALADDNAWMYNRNNSVEVAQRLEARCRRDETLACGMLTWGAFKRQQSFDEARAMAACAAGFRDICVVIAETSHDASTTLAALRHGCDAPDAQLCLLLADVLAGDCKFPACPRPDSKGADRAFATACTLAPAISARCGH